MNGCLNVMRYLKMLPGNAPPVQNPVWIERIASVTSETAGVFYPTVKRGRYVQQGMKIGYVTDLFGKTVWEARAPSSGVVLYVCAVPSMKKGETVANIGVVAGNAIAGGHRFGDADTSSAIPANFTSGSLVSVARPTRSLREWTYLQRQVQSKNHHPCVVPVYHRSRWLLSRSVGTQPENRVPGIFLSAAARAAPSFASQRKPLVAGRSSTSEQSYLRSDLSW
jgi:hypothetical protein